MNMMFYLILLFSNIMLDNYVCCPNEYFNITPKGWDSSSVMYFKTVLKDFGIHSFFLTINVVDAKGRRTGVISNSALYGYLKNTQNLSKQEYYDKMLCLLMWNRPLVLGYDSICSENGFCSFQESPKINQLAKKGKEYFLKYYFSEDKYMIKNFSDEEGCAVISKLIKWRLLVTTACVSGRVFFINKPVQEYINEREEFNRMKDSLNRQNEQKN